MSRRQSIDYLRQLCSLGLPGESVAPALLEALHSIIPAEANSIVWRDWRGRTNRILVESIRGEVPLQPVYRDDTAEARARELFAGCADILHGYWGNRLSDGTSTPVNSAFPGLTQEVGNDCTATGLVCCISRSTRFNPDEEQTLKALLPYFARALIEPDMGPAPLVASGCEGFLLADYRGLPQHISPDARQLLCRAQLYTPHAKCSESALNAGLERLAERKVSDSDNPEGKANAELPVWRHRMPWGTFIFHAYHLDRLPPLQRPAPPTQPLTFELAQGQLITIRVCVREPLPIKLLGQLQQVPLSPRQREIALWLAQGFSLDNICRQLHIDEGAAAARTRAIYETLNVHDRAELACRLLA